MLNAVVTGVGIGVYAGDLTPSTIYVGDTEMYMPPRKTQCPICKKRGGGESPTGERVDAPQALTCNTNTGVRIE